jgi:hypothetical protein
VIDVAEPIHRNTEQIGVQASNRHAVLRTTLSLKTMPQADMTELTARSREAELRRRRIKTRPVAEMATAA